jgi:serine/threonine-protein kinase
MATTTTPDLISLQEVVAGRYSIERELGRGGMGIVYLARDVALERPVAIKMLPPHLAGDPGMRERFVREARTVAKLSHPNIVPIHSVEEHGDIVFFAMGFIEGETLTSRIVRAGPLGSREAARIIQEIAWALAYAHGAGVVHRDVKADNVLLDRASGRAMLTDFGIARVAGGGQLTAAGEMLGTAQYVSPEQVSGGTIDGRSDLYSLGVTGFYALTGRLPFEGQTMVALIGMHLT